MFFWRSPTVCQFKMADRRMRAQHKLKLLDVAWQYPDCSLLFPCSISFAESFVTCLRNKAHVYLLNLLIYLKSIATISLKVDRVFYDGTSAILWIVKFTREGNASLTYDLVQLQNKQTRDSSRRYIHQNGSYRGWRINQCPLWNIDYL